MGRGFVKVAVIFLVAVDRSNGGKRYAVEDHGRQRHVANRTGGVVGSQGGLKGEGANRQTDARIFAANRADDGVDLWAIGVERVRSDPRDQKVRWRGRIPSERLWR